MLFWNMAVAKGGGEKFHAIALKHIAKTEEEAADLRAFAASMVERHRQMFPALHAMRREAPVAG